MPLALVPNLATKWHHLHQLQIWPPDCATCISCKFDHQMAPLALVAKLATRWRHLHELQIWPQDGTTCISCNIDHQMAPLALVANLPTRWRYLHCFQSWPPDCISCIATLLYWHYQFVLSLYLHQLESHQLSLHKWLSDLETTRPIDRTRDTWVR